MPTPDEDGRLLAAVRHSIQHQVRVALRAHEPAAPADIRVCPRCGDRAIVLERPVSYGIEAGLRVCKPCRAVTELTAIISPSFDLGGEGG